MTSPESKRYTQEPFDFDRMNHADLEDAHALADETDHPAGLNARRQMANIDATEHKASEDALDEEWRRGYVSAQETRKDTTTESQPGMERSRVPEDATDDELADILNGLFEEENAGALRNNGKARIGIGLVSIHAAKKGIMTRQQASRGLDHLELRASLQRAGISDSPAPHVRDWAERAANDRFDD